MPAPHLSRSFLPLCAHCHSVASVGRLYVPACRHRASGDSPYPVVHAAGLLRRVRPLAGLLSASSTGFSAAAASDLGSAGRAWRRLRGSGAAGAPSAGGSRQRRTAARESWHHRDARERATSGGCRRRPGGRLGPWPPLWRRLRPAVRDLGHHHPHGPRAGLRGRRPARLAAAACCESGIWFRRPSSDGADQGLHDQLHERMASSLPGMTKSTSSGSQLVSTSPIRGRPSLFTSSWRWLPAWGR